MPFQERKIAAKMKLSQMEAELSAASDQLKALKESERSRKAMSVRSGYTSPVRKSCNWLLYLVHIEGASILAFISCCIVRKFCANNLVKMPMYFIQHCTSGNIWCVWLLPLDEVEGGSLYSFYGIPLP